MEEKELLEETEELEVVSETNILEHLTDNTPLKGQKKPQEEEESFLKEVLYFLRDLAICFIVFWIVVTFIARPVQVNGSSMYPTLENGELGFSNIIGRKLGGIDRFDIVIVYLDDKDEYLVKRCVGLPGETISFMNNQLYINGEVVEQNFFDEEYISQYGDSFTSDLEAITLGEDDYYCMGDNRPHSTDSRFYGPFHSEQIVSKGIFVIFPISSFGLRTW